jgi:prepilin-type N-terminal cleavage/methylation domain-containing protein
MDFTHASSTYARRPSYGFTFLECLLTLAIISIVASLAAFGLLKYANRRTLLLETDRIRLLLEHAAILALTTGDDVGVTLLDGEVAVTPRNSTHSIRYQFPSEIQVKRVGSTSQAPLAFYPTITASPTTLSVISTGGACSITISLRTRITALC